MADLTRTRSRLRAVVAGLLALSALAAVALVTPLVGSRSDYQQQYDQLRPQLQMRLQQTAPLDNMEAKVERARQESARFFEERLPAHSSAIAERLGVLTAAQGVHISQVRYRTEAVEGHPGLQRVLIDAGLAGGYLQVVKFINALERDPMFFIVDGLSLAEQEGGRVRVEVTLETFLRPTPPPPLQGQGE
jgi:type IV pilus assembly protein PilO